ncbi:hypothetical protein INR49_017695 [Caranx melampygus]|nr:hypothetical protein INR49_017695 [Caranx melampygus]
MERSAQTVSAIQALGYPGRCCLTRCKCDELPCPLLTWLCAELRTVCPELRGETGDMLLVGELRNLLSEMSCPPTVLTTDVLEPSILNNITELQAAHMIQHKESHPEETTGDQCEKEQRVTDHSQEVCQDHDDDDVSNRDKRNAEMQADWILLLRSLDMDTSSQLTDMLSEVRLTTERLSQVESRLARLPCGGMMDPLLKTSLSSEQWVVERCEALASVPPLASLIWSSRVSLSHLLAAREDQSFIEPIKAGTSTHGWAAYLTEEDDRGKLSHLCQHGKIADQKEIDQEEEVDTINDSGTTTDGQGCTSSLSCSGANASPSICCGCSSCSTQAARSEPHQAQPMYQQQPQSVYQQEVPQQQQACSYELKQFVECAQNQSDLKLCEGFSEVLKQCRFANACCEL